MANMAPFSNNAPPPVPGYGNPTGIAAGTPGAASTTSPFPFLPQHGAPSYNQGPFNATNIGSLSSGFPQGANPQNLLKELQDAYGKGEGSVLDQILSKGLFNPQIAAAFLNAQQPGINRGEADIFNAFGDAGTRFSSSAGLGIGDYLSQVQLNQQSTLASLFQQDQSEQLSLLGSILPTLHLEEANRDRGFFEKLIGGAEIGIGLLTGSGGAVSSGNAALFGEQSNINGSGSGQQSLLDVIKKLFPGTGPGGQTAGQGSTAAGIPSSSGTLDELNQVTLNTQAGTVFGGSDPFANGGTGGQDDQLLQYLMSQGLLDPSGFGGSN